jgi:hypothetical protein
MRLHDRTDVRLPRFRGRRSHWHGCCKSQPSRHRSSTPRSRTTWTMPSRRFRRRCRRRRSHGSRSLMCRTLLQDSPEDVAVGPHNMARATGLALLSEKPALRAAYRSSRCAGSRRRSRRCRDRQRSEVGAGRARPSTCRALPETTGNTAGTLPASACPRYPACRGS